MVGGILITEGKLLLIRRAADEISSAGYWETPKGRVEFGEDPEKALQREFLEEVNLRVELDNVHAVFSHTYTRDDAEVHFWEVEYFVHLAMDESLDNIKLSRDHDAYKLADIEDLKNLEKIYDDKRDSLLRALADKL